MSAELPAAGRIVRRHDRERFLTALFAPGDRRDDLFALYAFNHEIARVREVVSEPMLGQIRLQWWREAIAAIYAGAPARRHEIVLPLAKAIRRRALTREHFDHLIDARERDLGDEPPASLTALEAYAEESSSRLVRLSLEVLGVHDAEANRAGDQVGIAWALAGLIRAIPFHARMKRSYIPADVAAETGLRLDDLFERRSSTPLRDAVRRLAQAAGGHLAQSRARASRVPRAAVPALLPARLADRHLARLRRANFDPFSPSLVRPDPLAPARLMIAASTGRF